jgi:hypothetical protein
MLWILISLFFFWCAFREIRGSLVAPPGFDSPMPVTKPYLALAVCLADSSSVVFSKVFVRESHRTS